MRRGSTLGMLILRGFCTLNDPSRFVCRIFAKLPFVWKDATTNSPQRFFRIKLGPPLP